MIRAQVFPKKHLLTRRVSWGYRFVGGNNEPFGHDYNSREGAEKSLRRLVSQNIGVELEVEHLDGTIEQKGRIR